MSLFLLAFLGPLANIWLLCCQIIKEKASHCKTRNRMESRRFNNQYAYSLFNLIWDLQNTQFKYNFKFVIKNFVSVGWITDYDQLGVTLVQQAGLQVRLCPLFLVLPLPSLNTPAKFRRPEFRLSVYPVLAALASYNRSLDQACRRSSSSVSSTGCFLAIAISWVVLFGLTRVLLVF